MKTMENLPHEKTKEMSDQLSDIGRRINNFEDVTRLVLKARTVLELSYCKFTAAFKFNTQRNIQRRYH